MEYSHEFLTLLEKIAEDGELTFQEIYQIGVWLNKNKESRMLWPADVFYRLLKDVFTDGKIEKSEAKEVGSLIQTVMREWTRKSHVATPPTVHELVSKALESFSPDVALLPTPPIQLRIESHSTAGEEYVVDLSGPSCTCPDFASGRKGLPVGNLSRCCKHILQAYAQVCPTDGWPFWLDSFLELGIRPNPMQKWMILKLGKDYALISSAASEWANVYLKTRDGNLRFGFNPKEDRWAYGNEPSYAAKIETGIEELSQASRQQSPNSSDH